MQKVRTRIAPSPTGRMHIGTVRTALFNYLFAKHNKGDFIVRIEDTDKERSKKEWEDAIYEDFEWCGLSPDEKYRQSDNVDAHTKALKDMIDREVAYISSEPSTQDPTKTVEVVRLKNPGKTITFKDEIRGEISFDITELKDFVIARSVDDPLYHLAVVVDDHNQNITHVIRAEEHISNTPRQILIQEALGYERPVYAHVPLILAPDKSKLSKRKHSASIDLYREQGFLPEAVINYLALLGWNPGTPQEIFSIKELIEVFTLNGVQKSGAIFGLEKLRWFNKEHLKKLSDEDFAIKAIERLAHAGIIESATARRTVPVLKERIEVWDDIQQMLEEGGELRFLALDTLELDPQKIPWKGDSAEGALAHLNHSRGLLEASESLESADLVKNVIWPYAEENGRGSVLWPLRYALTGQDKSPDPFSVVSILGKEKTFERIDAAISTLK